MPRVFVDGSAGTTGLRIVQRLKERSDVEVITLSDAERKNADRRREMLNQCDAAFLCLPDAAAIEAVNMIENDHVVVLDTSTAHRTSPDFAYGFPELTPAHRAAIRQSHRIAVPGCHASGFIALIRPLVDEGLIDPGTALTCTSLTGYSGGGKAMIAQYEAPDRDLSWGAPRPYGLTQTHKHLKEMVAQANVAAAPVFMPIVGPYYSGMLVNVGLSIRQLRPGVTRTTIMEAYRAHYTGPMVTYAEDPGENGFLCAAAYAGRDDMQISVQGNEERIVLTALYDNLGKGASGAAIQCMNLVFGFDETAGLNRAAVVPS